MGFYFSFLVLVLPMAVSACEGDCIVGVTNAFVSNYTTPTHFVMQNMVRFISPFYGLLNMNPTAHAMPFAQAQQISNLIPGHPSVDTAMTYLEPIQAAYRTQAYQNMETGIFPSYFHGKCLDKNGQEPAGCPNPDCPVVCGTPGSMVHFYSRLRFIAFNQTYHLIQRVFAPGSPSYNRVETLVLEASQSPPPPDERRRRRALSRFFSRDVSDALASTQDGPGDKISPRDSLSGSHFASGAGPSSGSHTGLGLPSGPGRRISKRAQDVRAGLRSIFQQSRALLLQACGGNGVDNTNGLPGCSWEAAMKAYILSFP